MSRPFQLLYLALHPQLSFCLTHTCNASPPPSPVSLSPHLLPLLSFSSPPVSPRHGQRHTNLSPPNNAPSDFHLIPTPHVHHPSPLNTACTPYPLCPAIVSTLFRCRPSKHPGTGYQVRIVPDKLLQEPLLPPHRPAPLPTPLRRALTCDPRFVAAERRPESFIRLSVVCQRAAERRCKIYRRENLVTTQRPVVTTTTTSTTHTTAATIVTIRSPQG